MNFGARKHNCRHTKFRWRKCPISKIQHGGRPPFWKLLYLHISAANRPNLTKFGMRTQILTQATETWQKFRNSQIQIGGQAPYWKSLFGYNSAPYCLIKMKFGVRRQNDTHTKVRWWKCLITKIKYSGHRNLKIVISPYLSRESSKFDESWYANTNLTQPRKHDKHKSEINIKTANRPSGATSL